MSSIPQISRRSMLSCTAASALALPFVGLYTRRAEALTRVEPVASPYGAIRPVPDQTTGLPLLQLPEGFSYQSFGWSGDIMDNGAPTPVAHDGMAVVRSRVVDGEAEFTLIRNHESRIVPMVGTIGAPTVYDDATVTLERNDETFTGTPAGGTTTLVYRGGQWVSATPSLGGTYVNCAGGPTAWGSWLTCEEDRMDFSDQGGKKHGYVFEVSDDPAKTTGNPIVEMGRMDHEAVALDPITGSIFLTEDDRNQAGLYKFVPNDMSKQLGSLEQGGKLYMAKVAGEDKMDLLDPKMGDQYQIEWIEIEDPDLDSQPYTEAPHDSDNMASGPFVQGRDKGCLRMSRLEGCWYSAMDRLVYLVDTSSGVDEEGTIGRGEGSVWTLDPASDQLTCIYQSENKAAGNNFDNVTVSPRGGVLLCEDGGGYEDDFGMGERLMGLTPAGETYLFAKNNVMLTRADLNRAGKSMEFIEADDHRDNEWAGATFDPSGRILFVNIQTPGITFAIAGPWERGLL